MTGILELTYHPILFQVSTNGVLSFKRAILTYHHTDLSEQREKTIIAPFWADVDTSKGGEVWYRVSKHPSDLKYATKNVRLSFQENINFESKWALVATWHKVGYYGRGERYHQLVSVLMFLIGCHRL